MQHAYVSLSPPSSDPPVESGAGSFIMTDWVDRREADAFCSPLESPREGAQAAVSEEQVKKVEELTASEARKA